MLQECAHINRSVTNAECEAVNRGFKIPWVLIYLFTDLLNYWRVVDVAEVVRWSEIPWRWQRCTVTTSTATARLISHDWSVRTLHLVSRPGLYQIRPCSVNMWDPHINFLTSLETTVFCGTQNFVPSCRIFPFLWTSVFSWNFVEFGTGQW